jgi:mRNA interferase RelE/StbE
LTNSIEFVDAAFADVVDLTPDVQRKVLKKLLLLEENLQAGEPLGNKRGMNLVGLRKLVVGNRTWRIIYKESGTTTAIVWVVRGRSDEECYRETQRRLESLGDNPSTRGLHELLARLDDVKSDRDAALEEFGAPSEPADASPERRRFRRRRRS